MFCCVCCMCLHTSMSVCLGSCSALVSRFFRICVYVCMYVCVGLSASKCVFVCFCVFARFFCLRDRFMCLW